jgi:ABC-type multidrug transport system fused ATPase/permease subunit
MFGTLTRCLGLLPREMRGRWAALVPLLVLTAGLEAASAAAIFALVRIVADPAQAAAMPVVGTLLHGLPALGPSGTIVLVAASVGLFFAAKNALGAFTAWAQARCLQDAAAATSVALIRGYLAAPWSFHLERRSSDLVHDAHPAVERIYRTVMAPALGIVTEGLVAIGIVAVLLAAAPRVTVVAVSVLLALSFLLVRVTRGAIVRLGARFDRASATALRRAQQVLGAVKELKVLGRDRGALDVYAADRRALADVGARYGGVSSLPRLVVETVFVCAALVVVVLLTARGGTAAETVPLLGLYAYAGFRVIPSANRIVWMIGEMRYGTAAVDRVSRDLRTLAGTPAAPTGACTFDDRLVVDGVSFAHDGDGRSVLHDVDLVLRRGEWLGVVGATGAGKSTLVDLVVGLLEPTHGRITVDGVDLRRCAPAWQRQIGYVPQSVFLVDDTLRRNVALGVPDGDVDEARVRTALRLAQLEPLVSSLPAGLDTPVRDLRLSGGERQRVGIARALYGEPRVLVFDEATSALDGATEAALADALRTLAGGVTMLLVAHRTTSVRRCDRVVILHEGRIVDTGSVDELAARSAEFRALAAMPDEP